MKIGELASHAGAQVETIRYYEREGLLPETARTDGNYRIYGPTHAERLRFIRNCRSLDMTLDEIRLLLRFKDSPAENCGGVNDLLDQPQFPGHGSNALASLHSFHRQSLELGRVFLLRYLLQLRFSFQFTGALYPISWKTNFRGKLIFDGAVIHR